jgi:hypothetical protein
MLIPFTTREQKIVARIRAEYLSKLTLVAEMKGVVEGNCDLHPELLGFIVPDPPGLAPINPAGAPQPPTEQPHIQQ